jgi:prepilin peptidase CpaA
MNSRDIIWALALLLTLTAAVVDWRHRRIPNWLTVPALVAGITAHSVLSGWAGAKMSLEGAGLGLVLLLPFVLLRAMGAGDWKLMGAVGAFLGPILFLFVFLGSVLVGGLMAIVEAVRAGKLKETIHNMGTLALGFAVFGFHANPEISIDNPKSLKVPFGVAVAMATIACCVAAYRVH